MESRSEFLSVRGLRYHVRVWGAPEAMPVVLLHGWLDVSATWAPVAQGLLPRFRVLAPDWRGFGHSQWPQDGYWFYDYVADLECLLDRLSPAEPVRLVGHSMGGQVASLYAGLRPDRVRRLVLLDSLFLPDMGPEVAGKRFRAWLDQLKDPPQQKTYDSFEDLAGRIRKQHPRLTPERALFVARCWGREDGYGRIGLCADPKHRLHGPGTYRVAESMEVWQHVTAPTLFVDTGQSSFGQAISREETARRRACFRDRREVRIEQAGHMLHFDAPDETARHIAAFLSE